MDVVIRINGRGNAWPLELGTRGTRHRSLRCSASEYANTSLSILGYASMDDEEPQWEVLFDVGQGVLPFLVQNGNRLPDAVLLSHPHYDHVSGLDWLGASHRRNRDGQAKLPVFTTAPCWMDIISHYPWLSADFDPVALELRQRTNIDVAPGLSVTAFSVFHGAYAPGACLMLIEYVGKSGQAKAILSGDLLCPLIEPHDYDLLKEAAVAYVDANTRFPCPRSGHWSIVEKSSPVAESLMAWIGKQDIDRLLAPHVGARGFEAFAESFKRSIDSLHQLCWSINSFVERAAPRSVALVHYSGYEDVTDHQETILIDTDLLEWVGNAARSKTVWRVPPIADEFVLYKEV